jgi:transposase
MSRHYILRMLHGKHSTIEIRQNAVKAVMRGESVTSVAKHYHCDRVTLHRWVKKYRARGRLSDLEISSRSGRPRKLACDDVKQLHRIILRRPTKFGFETDFWTSRRLVHLAKQTCGTKVSRSTMLRILDDLDLSYQKPEKRYLQASKKLKREWIRDTIPEILAAQRKYRAIIYFQDEASIQLAPVLAKTWAPRGKTPKVVVTGKRGSVAAMSAISRCGQLVFTLHQKRIKSQEVIHFLEQMLRHHPRRHLVVVMDRAKPHTSKVTKAFIDKQKRLHVFYLPPYSPEFNPDEKVWSHLKHVELSSHQANSKEALKKAAGRKLAKMSRNDSLLRGIFRRCCVAELMT